MKIVDDMKSDLIHCITVAQLNLPFDDALLLSKFVFLNSNKKTHPNLKDIFPALTQDELDKLIKDVTVIDYSDDGFFYTITKENRKRNQEEPSKSIAAA